MITIVAHADWSIQAAKRRITVAQREPGIGWRARAPQPVGDVAVLIERLFREANGGGVVLALDLPIGVPAAYARRVVQDYHGGRLTIRESAPGQGTTVVVSFPT